MGTAARHLDFKPIPDSLFWQIGAGEIPLNDDFLVPRASHLQKPADQIAKASHVSSEKSDRRTRIALDSARNQRDVQGLLLTFSIGPVGAPPQKFIHLSVQIDSLSLRLFSRIQDFGGCVIAREDFRFSKLFRQ